MSHMVEVTEEMRAAFREDELQRHVAAVLKHAENFAKAMAAEEREHDLRAGVNETITHVEVRDEGEP